MDKLDDLLRSKQNDIARKLQIKEKWIRSGFTMIPNILLLDKRISPQAKTVFVVICLHAFNKDYAFPSYELLQEEIGLGRTQLNQYLKELKDAKLIGVKRTGRANMYEIQFDALNERVDSVIAHLKKVKERLAKKEDADI